MTIPNLVCKCGKNLGKPKWKDNPSRYKSNNFEEFGDKSVLHKKSKWANWGKRGWYIDLKCKNCNGYFLNPHPNDT